MPRCKICGEEAQIEQMGRGDADMVIEVVQCKDCIHSNPYSSNRETVLCKKRQNSIVSSNGFCNYGEERPVCFACVNYEDFKIEEEKNMSRGQRAQIISAIALLLSLITFIVTVAEKVI